MSSFQDLVTIVRRDGKIEYQSPTVTEVLGYTPDDLQDEDFFSFVHPDDHDQVRDTLGELFADTSPQTRRVEYRFRRKSRSWAWVSSLGSRWQDTVVLNSQNVTGQKEKRQQVTVLHRILRHNLRNELNTIIARAEILTEAEDPDQIERNAEKITQCASRLDRLAENTRVIDDLSDGQRADEQPQDIAPILSELIEEFRDEHPAVDFDVTLLDNQYVPGSPNIEVALRQVVENAIRHNDSENPIVKVHMSSRTATPDESEVAISDTPDELEVAISDNGPGIPQQERTVLVEGDETPLQHGSGTGLWIVNWVVSHCGGRIKFERSQFGGSRVCLIFPTL